MPTASTCQVPTWVPRAAAVPLALSILLPVCILLRVLEAQLVADLEGLPDRPHDSHSLALGGRKEKKRASEGRGDPLQGNKKGQGQERMCRGHVDRDP